VLIRLLRHACWAALLIGCGAAHSPEPAPPRPSPAASVGADTSWRNRIPGPAEPGTLRYPEPQVHRLPNGLKVYLVRRAASVISLWVVARCETSLLPRGKSGLAAVTTRMLTEATQRRSALELAEAAESLGSSLEHNTGRDHCAVSLLTLRPDFSAGLQLLAEVVAQPAFAPADWDRVRSEWTDGLRVERQSPSRLASLAGLRLLLGEVHGAPVNGSVPDVEALSVDDLRAYHAQAFVPQRSAVIVVGELGWQELGPQVERHFSSWTGSPGAATPPPPLPAPEQRTRIVLVDRPGAVQSALFVAQPFPRRSVAGHEARLVLSGLFGGLFTSRLNQNLREQHGYTYGAYSRAIATRHWGALVMTTAVATDVTAPADTAGLFAQQLPNDYYASFPQRLARLSRPAVERQARAQLRPEALVVVVVGDRQQVEAELRTNEVIVESATPQLVN
jgi:zinc protease